jgi:hypothetical protein
MRLAWRLGVLLVVSVGVGVLVDKVVLRHSSAQGAYEPQVRLGAATAGLFAAGVAATLVGIGMTLGRKK